MNKYRLLFSKTGRAVYASHLDLMRTLRRAFRRAGIDLRHSEGFNPHPLMSIVLPLSVGQESVCELLDFETAAPCDLAALPELLNPVLPDGIRAVSAYASARKISALKWVAVDCALKYNDEVPDIRAFAEIFRRESLIITKKTKRSETDIDLIAAVRDARFGYNGEFLSLRALISVRDPVVNPAMLVEALDSKPEYATFRRTELYCENLEIFR